MKKIFYTVGPSQIYPTVARHIKNAISTDVLSLSHRGEGFSEIYKSTVKGVRKLLNVPESHEIVFVGSALEAMERVTQAMSHNNTYHIITGNFGKIWSGIAKDLKKNTQEFTLFEKDTAKMSDISLKNIKIPEESELVCITQNDTSVGFSIPLEQIYTLRKKYPKSLFALDVVSSAPYVDIEYKNLDAVFFSVQKGFGLPPGLCVLILSPKAVKYARKLQNLPNYSTGSYHSIPKLVDNGAKFQTTETPNILGFYLLDCVIKDMLKIGIKRIRQDTEEKAQMIYSFFSRPERGENYRDTQYLGVPYVKQSEYLSVTDPVIEIKGGSEGIRKFAAEKGLILGAGYGERKNEHIRIANFPAQSVSDTKKLIKVFEDYEKTLK